MTNQELPQKGKSILQLSEDDRPREKLLQKGREHLTNSELLAILIGSGNAQKSALDLGKEVLDLAQNKLQELGKFKTKDFLKIKGIGPAKAVTLIAALELGRRRKDEEALERKKISGSKDAYLVLSELLSDLDHEQFWIIYLNRGGYLLKRVRISEGGIAGTVVDPKIIFMHALELKASTIILAHNHPSGNLQPSQADIQITKKVQEGGKMLDIFVADHIIIANSSFYSFADEGLL